MIWTILTWCFIIILSISAVTAIRSIGKDRKPLDADDAVGAVVLVAILIAILLH